MHFVRKALVFLAAAVLPLLLFLTISAVTVLLVFGNPNTIKGWLGRSGIYDNFINAMVEEIDKATNKEGGGSDTKLDTGLLRQVSQKAFTPQFLQQSAEQFIDGTYRWLNGEVPKPDFAIDLASVKINFAEEAGNQVRAKAATLPKCPKNQKPPEELDIMNATCLPAGLNIETEVQKTVDEIKNSKEFLPEPTLTADSIKTKDKQTGQEKPFFEAMSEAPKAFKTFKIAPYIFGTLATLGAVIVIFLSADRIKGLRRVGTIFLSLAAILLVSTLASKGLLEFAKNQLESGVLKSTLIPLIDQAEKTFRNINIWFSAGFGTSGLAAIVVPLFFRKPADQIPATKTGKKALTEPEPPKTPKEPPKKVVQ